MTVVPPVIVRRLQEHGIKTALVSNADSRMRMCYLHFYKKQLFTSISPVSVLADLEVSDYLQPIVTSEIEEIEKPDARLFHIACQRAGVPAVNAAHVGDELVWSVHS